MDTKVRTAEQELARLAGRSHGVVTRAELLAVGVSTEQVKHRVRTGALLPEFRGVYRVGHRAPSMEARYLAAVRACGDGALLRRRAAAHLFELLRGPPPAPEVMAPTQRRVPG
ncbi:MAG: type IV toxin-antitoxin system AbiEi family antitoxin domain-containing protein, partial [Thermoleophilaceae bacterium]|nr:type IV toxin-antitoxin system AbiEi family antitoxin domain-containing protein [Thermoleophilaceae bacterium]